MGERPSIYVAIFACLVCQASADCRIEGSTGDCNYTIVCESIVTPVPLPDCDHPNHALVIKNSSVEHFTEDFFPFFFNISDNVKTLKAVNNQWTHIGPLAFHFVMCTHMDLSGNGIKTVHSASFRFSYVLRELNLSRNSIESMFECNIGLDGPINITVLDLSFNFLTNLSADEMSCFPELRKLYLQGNKLSFLSDGAFAATLGKLNYLSLGNNQLTTLMGTVDNSRSLKILDVSFNRIKQLSSRYLIDCISLEHIVMSQNDIETIDFTAFNGTTNLQTVDLSNNKIKSLILTFAHNTELKSLNFHSNNISIMNCTFPSSKKLESIDLSSNNLSELPVGSISNAHNLKLLNLSSNCLTSISDGSLKELKDLTVLDLSRNKLNKIGVNELNQCVNLKRLILDNNSIKKLDFDNLLDALPQLEVISVGGSLIPCQDISEHHAKGLKNNVSVTAVDKVYDRSNIFGISCDNSTGPRVIVNKPESFNLWNMVLMWSGLMTLIIAVLLIAGVWSCINKCRKSKHTYDVEPRVMALPRIADELDSADSSRERPVESSL